MACLDESVLTAWVKGTLADAVRERAIVHIAECAMCRETVSALVQVEWTGDEERRGDVVVGLQLGRYRVERVIGRGGMGVVVEAHDPSLGRQVAIKILRPDADEDRVSALEARLSREARVLARLRHPNIVPVHDAGRDAELLYLVMELVDGESLRAWCALDPGRTFAVRLSACIAAARGVAALHDAGFVHRDIKPDNILVARDGRVLVADLGLAISVGDEVSRLTRGDIIVGTPRYMAPEYARGAGPDPLIDQYSFAITAREVIGELPGRVARVLDRASSADPRARYRSMLELVCALEAAARPDPRGRVVGAAAAVTAVTAAAALASCIGVGRLDSSSGGTLYSNKIHATTTAEAESRMAMVCVLPGQSPGEVPMLDWGKVEARSIAEVTVGGVPRKMTLYRVAGARETYVFDGAQYAGDRFGVLDAKVGQLVIFCPNAASPSTDVELPAEFGHRLWSVLGYGPIERPPPLASHDPPLYAIHNPVGTIAMAAGGNLHEPYQWPLPPDSQVLLFDSYRERRADGRYEMQGQWLMEADASTKGLHELTRWKGRWIIATFAHFDGKKPVLHALEVVPHLFAQD